MSCDEHDVVQKLFATLTASEQKGSEEISRKRLEMERLLSAVEVFQRFATELGDSGTASDVASGAERLRVRAGELKKHDVVRQTRLPLAVNCVAFQPASFGSSKPPSNLVGSIEEKPSFKGLNKYSTLPLSV